MSLLDNVSLIESEVLAPPTASTFKRSITKLASYEHNDSWNIISSVIIHMIMIGSHHWKKTGKIADFFGETRLEVKVKSLNPVSVEHRSVEYSQSHVAGYPK